MIAIDSSALIAILRGEPKADDFLRAIAASEACLMSAFTYQETSMVLAGRSGNASSWADLDALVARAGIEVVVQDASLARQARSAFLLYGKGRHRAGRNFGDCASYALAKSLDIALLYKGADFVETDIASAL